nr:MAG TPA: hypothetical protein [Caudoviricetes sp.]
MKQNVVQNPHHFRRAVVRVLSTRKTLIYTTKRYNLIWLHSKQW